MWLAQRTAAERRSNVEEKTGKPCRHQAHAGTNWGWMPENYPSLPPGVKYFLLTSPSIEPGVLRLAQLRANSFCSKRRLHHRSPPREETTDHNRGRYCTRELPHCWNQVPPMVSYSAKGINRFTAVNLPAARWQPDQRDFSLAGSRFNRFTHSNRRLLRSSQVGVSCLSLALSLSPLIAFMDGAYNLLYVRTEVAGGEGQRGCF